MNKSIPQTHLGWVLTGVLHKHYVTAKNLSKESGVNASQISRWMTQRSPLREKGFIALERIAESLGKLEPGVEEVIRAVAGIAPHQRGIAAADAHACIDGILRDSGAYEVRSTDEYVMRTSQQILVDTLQLVRPVDEPVRRQHPEDNCYDPDQVLDAIRQIHLVTFSGNAELALDNLERFARYLSVLPIVDAVVSESASRLWREKIRSTIEANSPRGLSSTSMMRERSLAAAERGRIPQRLRSNLELDAEFGELISERVLLDSMNVSLTNRYDLAEGMSFFRFNRVVKDDEYFTSEGVWIQIERAKAWLGVARSTQSTEAVKNFDYYSESAIHLASKRISESMDPQEKLGLHLALALAYEARARGLLLTQIGAESEVHLNLTLGKNAIHGLGFATTEYQIELTLAKALLRSYKRSSNIDAITQYVNDLIERAPSSLQRHKAQKLVESMVPNVDLSGSST